jgi:hypothetical protein
MPTYTFKLRDDDEGIDDDIGINLPNAAIAYRYACDIARELMNHREQSTLYWRLDVYQDNGERVFDTLLAKLD